MLPRSLPSLLIALSLWSLPAAGHGVLGHVHVTGWAIENLPPGELRDFFSDPAVFNAALFGAVFTDSGYPQTDPDLKAAAGAYSEHAHWEPFIRDFIAWIRANDPPPWNNVESRKRIAFLMGCAAHGLQDEIFDSLFLAQVGEHDGKGQNEADPASDGFLAMDGHLRFFPTVWIPMETVLELYAPLQAGITQEVIDKSVDLTTSVYVNAELGPVIARELGKEFAPQVPWMRDHYMDPDVPGSFLSEVTPTRRYLEAIWERLHDRLDPDAYVIHTFPEPPRRLHGTAEGSPDAWVTLIYGIGVGVDSLQATWIDVAGADVGFDVSGTKWGAAWTRLHRLQPKAALAPGATYSVTVAAGLNPIVGAPSPSPFVLEFQAACETAHDPKCPDLGDIPTPSVTGPPEDPPEPEPEAEADAAEAPPRTDLGAGPDESEVSAEEDGGSCQVVGHRPHRGHLGLLVLLALGLLAAAQRIFRCMPQRGHSSTSMGLTRGSTSPRPMPPSHR